MDIRLNDISASFPAGWTPDKTSAAKTIFFKRIALAAHRFYGGKIQVLPRASLPGFGWFIEPKTDTTKEVIYHTGDNGGFKILAARYPEDNALVLVFANRADWDRYPLMQQIEEIFGF